METLLVGNSFERQYALVPASKKYFPPRPDLSLPVAIVLLVERRDSGLTMRQKSRFATPELQGAVSVRVEK